MLWAETILPLRGWYREKELRGSSLMFPEPAKEGPGKRRIHQRGDQRLGQNRAKTPEENGQLPHATERLSTRTEGAQVPITALMRAVSVRMERDDK